MITIGMDPIIFSIGGLVVSWHGLLTALAVVLAVWFCAWMAPRMRFTADNVLSVALWAVPGGIVGARLEPVLENLPYYTANPIKMFSVWEGGVSLYGALIGGTIAGIIAARAMRLSVPRLMDLAAPAMLLAQIIGRIGCVINGDSPGTLTSLPWGFVYTHPNAATTTYLYQARHPAPVYEIIWDLLVLGVIWLYMKKPRPAGAVFLLYFSMYSAGRFAISSVRAENAVLGPLHMAHIISIISIAICVPIFFYLTRRGTPAGDGPVPQPSKSVNDPENKDLS